MAFSTNVYPNLVDWARLIDPDGAVANVAWMLSQCNDVLKDIIWQEANQPLGHKVTLNAALPQPIWRGNNQGTPSTKMLTDQVQFAIGMLTDYSKVDKAEADLYGNTEKFRYIQDQSHVEGMSQTVASAMFYSNEQINPAQFTGLTPYYSSVSTTTAQTAKNVVDCGGTGSSNASMWLASWGDNTLFGIFPKGSQAGLVYENKGDLRELYDANGNGFEGYTSYFEWKLGLAVKDWRYNVRLANIDTTTAGLLGANPPDLNVYMSIAANKTPTSSKRMSGIVESDAPTDPVPGITQAWYMNRTVKTALEIQAIRDKNVLIGMKEYAGEPVLMWRDVPVRVNDALVNTEARAV